jgi:hypothetical protein
VGKALGILMAAAGGVLVIATVPFFDDAEVRKWFPAFLIGGGFLLWFGIKKFRNE